MNESSTVRTPHQSLVSKTIDHELSIAKTLHHDLPLLKTIHSEIIEHLRSHCAVDFGTLPSPQESESLNHQIRHRLSEKYSFYPEKIKERVLSEFLGEGPLQPLLSDPYITEIIVNRHDNIWYERRGHLHLHEDHFFSKLSYQNFLHRLSAEARVQANLDRPFADGFWRQFRVHLIIPPLAQGSAHLSLRRHPENPWTLAQLENLGWAPSEAISYLKKMVHARKSFLIIGATGTGKTSVLSACLHEVEKNERVVVIEDSSEIQIPNSLSVKLLARQDLNGILRDIDQSELLRQALRMRPDRIVMGEVRGAEAKDLLMTLSTGHNGGIGTLHAESARQALYRLEMLIQMGAPQWSSRAIRHLIHFGLHAIVSLKRVNGERRLDSIHKITSLEETGFCLEKILF